MSVLKRLLKDLDEGAVERCARRRRCVASAEATTPQSGYVFDDEIEEEAREQRLRAVASLAAHVEGALVRVRDDKEDEDAAVFVERSVRTAVAPLLAEREAHDATLRAFFACASRTPERREEHVPTVALWAMAALGRACPERVLGNWESDDERALLLAEESAAYFAALRTALYTNRPGAFYARRPLMRRVGARLEALLDEVGGVERLALVGQHPRLRFH